MATKIRITRRVWISLAAVLVMLFVLMSISQSRRISSQTGEQLLKSALRWEGQLWGGGEAFLARKQWKTSEAARWRFVVLDDSSARSDYLATVDIDYNSAVPGEFRLVYPSGKTYEYTYSTDTWKDIPAETVESKNFDSHAVVGIELLE